jgi:hypothetical protein
MAVDTVVTSASRFSEGSGGLSTVGGAGAGRVGWGAGAGRSGCGGIEAVAGGEPPQLPIRLLVVMATRTSRSTGSKRLKLPVASR